MKLLGKTFDRLELLLKWLASILMVIFTILTLAQVVMRYVFSNPLSWSEQAARYLFVWMLMLYMPVLMRNNNNMSFDLFTRKLKPAVQDRLWLVCEILIAFFAGNYCLYSFQLCQKFAAKTMVGLGIKAPWVYSSQIVGAGILCLFTVEIILRHIKRIRADKKGVA